MSESEQHKSKRVVIIGGGISGLCLALALEHLSSTTDTKWSCFIFEAKTSFAYNQSPHYILWKYGIKALIELGLGSHLADISAPIASLKSVDPATDEILVDWNNESSAVDSEASNDDDGLPGLYAEFDIGLGSVGVICCGSYYQPSPRSCN